MTGPDLEGLRAMIPMESRPVHRGGTLAVIESDVAEKSGRPVAKTIQTQIYHYPRD